jgi:hypothetical protein
MVAHNALDPDPRDQAAQDSRDVKPGITGKFGCIPLYLGYFPRTPYIQRNWPVPLNIKSVGTSAHNRIFSDSWKKAVGMAI